jgi:hypothetical protein
VLSSTELETAEWIIDRLAETDFDSADGLGDRLKSTEVDHHKVVDLHSGHIFNRFEGATGATDGHGFIKFTGAPTYAFTIRVFAGW